MPHSVLSGGDSGGGSQLTAFERSRGVFPYGPRTHLAAVLHCTWYPATLFREVLGSTSLVPSGLPCLGLQPKALPSTALWKSATRPVTEIGAAGLLTQHCTTAREAEGDTLQLFPHRASISPQPWSLSRLHKHNEEA